MSYETSQLYDVHVHWAKWTISILRLRYPGIQARLYKKTKSFVIVLETMPDGLSHDIFNSSIKPLTCDIELSLHAPLGSIYVDDFVSYKSELWLGGQPLPVGVLNQLLMLTSKKIPRGGLDFDVSKDQWIFTTADYLDEGQRALVVKGLEQIGHQGKINFVTSGARSDTESKKNVGQSYAALEIIPSQALSNSSTLKNLVEQDEDNWRAFVDQHSERNFDLSSPIRDYSCLFDAIDASDIRLSELLCIYDKVHIIPEVGSVDWLKKHQLTIKDLQILIQMGRVTLVFPYSINRYPLEIVLSAAEANSNSLTLSRTLSAKTFRQGLQKDPLLYSPLTSKERGAILGILSKNFGDESFKTTLNIYSNLFENQHLGFITRGAANSLGSGIGSILGELLFKVKHIDARLELMTNGAALEWALALGANYIPRNIGGFDETKNSLYLASFIGKTPVRITDPFTQRMHTTIDGLLSVSNIPPLDVAQNFDSRTIIKFRKLARRIMTQFDKQDDINDVVELLNEDVRAFESKRDRLKAWKIDSLIAGGIAKPLGDAVDANFGVFSSVIAAWLVEVLKSKLSPQVQNEIGTALDMLLALASLSPIDAVIVSRSKKF